MLNSEDSSMANATTMQQPRETTTTLSYTPPSDTLLFIYKSIAVVAILLNTVHLYILKCMVRLRHQKNYQCFVVIVAASDLGLGLARGLLSNNYVQEEMYNRRVLCVTTAVVIHTLLITTTTGMLLISIDRLLSLQQEDCYHRLIFVRHYSKIVVVAILAIAVLYVILGAVFSDVGFTVKGMGGCKFGSPKSPHLGLVSVGLCLVELIVITGIYCKIIILTKKVVSSSRRKTEKRNIKDIVLTIGVIVLAKIIFWCPIMFTVVARGLQRKCTACEWIGLITMSINPVVNPLLYGLTNRSYRMFIKRCIFCDYSKSSGSSEHCSKRRSCKHGITRQSNPQRQGKRAQVTFNLASTLDYSSTVHPGNCRVD